MEHFEEMKRRKMKHDVFVFIAILFMSCFVMIGAYAIGYGCGRECGHKEGTAQTNAAWMTMCVERGFAEIQKNGSLKLKDYEK